MVWVAFSVTPFALRASATVGERVEVGIAEQHGCEDEAESVSRVPLAIPLRDSRRLPQRRSVTVSAALSAARMHRLIMSDRFCPAQPISTALGSHRA